MWDEPWKTKTFLQKLRPVEEIKPEGKREVVKKMERSSPEKKRNGINEMFPKLDPGSRLQNIIEDYPTFPPFVKEGTWD